ncbi:MAG: adenylosuccinate lyase [Bacteroidia bacterium]
MELDTLSAISPVDGRYRKQTDQLAFYFSEFALIHHRVLVEIEYFISLVELLPGIKGKLNASTKNRLRRIYLNFSMADAKKVKKFESTTNHDVKAVEYFIKEKIVELELGNLEEYVHFGLTSQDINNTAVPLSVLHANTDVMIPVLQEFIDLLETKSNDWKKIPMLARTHGQPASPTKLGKEIKVFVERLETQLRQLKAVPNSAKFGGATGNFNAHLVAFPKINWVKFANEFIESLGLARSQYTTQIEHYDNFAAMCDAWKRINNILIDLCRDLWQYISLDYFKMQLVKGEVGSSAMPHKVNPIDFENAEGNLGVANAFFEHLSAKLPISRLQRDLTDSTVLRNIGVPMAHTLIAFKSVIKGMNKLSLNEEKIKSDLDENWAVIAEAIQTVLRREGFPKPYEALKELTRTNKKITHKEISKFIDGLKISAAVKTELKKISPHNYTGVY